MVDEIDRKLIEQLALDGRKPFAAIAEALGVSQTTVRARLSRLEDDDVISVVALCNALALGHQVVRLLLQVRNLTPSAVADSLVEIDQINHVALVAGSHDMYLEATCRDQRQLIDLLDEIRRHPGVASIQPIIVTSLAKDYTQQGLRGTATQRLSDPNS